MQGIRHARVFFIFEDGWLQELQDRHDKMILIDTSVKVQVFLLPPYAFESRSGRIKLYIVMGWIWQMKKWISNAGWV